jgi:hypothetical protein
MERTRPYNAPLIYQFLIMIDDDIKYEKRTHRHSIMYIYLLLIGNPLMIPGPDEKEKILILCSQYAAADREGGNNNENWIFILEANVLFLLVV